jgi:hypothetical protein
MGPIFEGRMSGCVAREGDQVIAFVDESCQEWPPGVYVLAAVIVAPDRLDTVRRSARETGAVRGRFHWHEADEQRRRKYLKSLTGFGLTAVVVVASPIAPRRPERARRKCLTTLLWELQGRGVQRVVFESRQEHQDRADRVALGAAVRTGTLTRDLAYEFGQPAQ